MRPKQDRCLCSDVGDKGTARRTQRAAHEHRHDEGALRITRCEAVRGQLRRPLTSTSQRRLRNETRCKPVVHVCTASPRVNECSSSHIQSLLKTSTRMPRSGPLPCALDPASKRHPTFQEGSTSPPFSSTFIGQIVSMTLLKGPAMPTSPQSQYFVTVAFAT